MVAGKGDFACFRNEHTVEIVYNETGYNEQPDITSNIGAEVWSRI